MARTEQRQHERFKVLLNGRVLLNDGSIGVRCCVRDASEGGCLVVSSRVLDFPDSVELVIDGFDQPLFAKVAWRTGRTAGLQFDWPAARQGGIVVDDLLELGSSLIIRQ